MSVDAAITITLVNKIREFKEGACEQAEAAASIVAISDDMEKSEDRWVSYSPRCLPVS